METNCSIIVATASDGLTRAFSPVVTLVVPGRLPSWNQVLGQGHWQRAKFKQGIADAFLSALRRSAGDSSTKTTSARNSMLTYAATLESYQTTRQQKRALKHAKKKLRRKAKSASKSKSSPPKVEAGV